MPDRCSAHSLTSNSFYQRKKKREEGLDVGHEEGTFRGEKTAHCDLSEPHKEKGWWGGGGGAEQRLN